MATNWPRGMILPPAPQNRQNVPRPPPTFFSMQNPPATIRTEDDEPHARRRRLNPPEDDPAAQEVLGFPARRPTLASELTEAERQERRAHYDYSRMRDPTGNPLPAGVNEYVGALWMNDGEYQERPYTVDHVNFILNMVRGVTPEGSRAYWINWFRANVDLIMAGHMPRFNRVPRVDKPTFYNARDVQAIVEGMYDRPFTRGQMPEWEDWFRVNRQRIADGREPLTNPPVLDYLDDDQELLPAPDVHYPPDAFHVRGRPGVLPQQGQGWMPSRQSLPRPPMGRDN